MVSCTTRPFCCILLALLLDCTQSNVISQKNLRFLNLQPEEYGEVMAQTRERHQKVFLLQERIAPGVLDSSQALLVSRGGRVYDSDEESESEEEEEEPPRKKKSKPTATKATAKKARAKKTTSAPKKKAKAPAKRLTKKRDKGPQKVGFGGVFKAFWVSLVDPSFEEKLKPKEEEEKAAPRTSAKARKPRTMSVSDLAGDS
eukprot:CAMPEP_0113943512 /NCGR_PEP_ID=MMETSP1339-20121228/25460_1 /TAXON_ID=94617 /ORGANISM="Fibrocapsa japonica" /LENGTH=200 /DNA_ID=CAMNT_0000948411 /DNA_START=9 /DNA_END=611 /DNA_ORIENTATION=+ /assembly_acc=CAM_ASM_000762